MSRLTRDGTAEPVSRDQVLRRVRGQGKCIFSLFSLLVVGQTIGLLNHVTEKSNGLALKLTKDTSRVQSPVATRIKKGS